jgi:hypothetical protein
MIAITVPKTAKKAVNKTLSGYIRQAAVKEGITLPVIFILANKKNPIFTNAPLTVKIKRAASRGNLYIYIFIYTYIYIYIYIYVYIYIYIYIYIYMYIYIHIYIDI